MPWQARKVACSEYSVPWSFSPFQEVASAISLFQEVPSARFDQATFHGSLTSTNLEGADRSVCKPGRLARARISEALSAVTSAHHLASWLGVHASRSRPLRYGTFFRASLLTRARPFFWSAWAALRVFARAPPLLRIFGEVEHA